MTGAIAAITSLMIAGPLLKRGIVLNLDFVLLPHAPLPNGFWALGPEMPRRIPVMLPVTWLDPVVGSVAAGKAMAVVAMAAAFAGAVRLARPVALPWRWAAGLIYAVGPFAATRLAVGHLFVLVAMAVLPFAAPRLLRPTRDLRRTYVAAFAMALTGVLGGFFALALVGAGAFDKGRRGVRAAVVALAAQAPWAVPGLIVYAGGAELAGADGFRPSVDGPSGLLALAGGHGFWQNRFQVAWDLGPLDAVLGLCVIGLAWRGRAAVGQRLPRLGAVGLGALALVAVSGIEVFDPVTRPLLALPGVSVVREVQRVLPLFLLWAGPAATFGAASWPSRAGTPALGVVRSGLAPASALVVGILLASPGAWGAGGQLEPATLPAGWTEVRDRVTAEPGTTLALPWFQYVDLDAAGGRRVLQPLPLWLGGDVLAASDPRIPGVDARERNDPREDTASRLVAANLGGAAIAADLAELGVRWVAVLDGGGLVRGRSFGELHVEALAEDAGLRHVVDAGTIDLFEVVDWRGAVVTSDGSRVSFDPIIGPFARLDAGEAAVYARPHAPGWMRGAAPAARHASGQVALPAGSGLLWYWPAALHLVASVVAFAAFVLCLRSKSRD